MSATSDKQTYLTNIHDK